MQDSDQRITKLENRVRELEKSAKFYDRNYFRNMYQHPRQTEEISVALTQEVWDRIETAGEKIGLSRHWILEEIVWETVGIEDASSPIVKNTSEKVSKQVRFDTRILSQIRNRAEKPEVNLTTSDIIQGLCDQFLEDFIKEELTRRGK